MLDAALIERYISENSSSNTEKYNKNLFNIINGFFNATDVGYNDLTRQDIIDIYSKLFFMKVRAFQSHKSKIAAFMYWMGKTGNGSPDILKELQEVDFDDMDRGKYFESYYFRDLNDLNSLLKAAFGTEICEYSTFYCMALLVWHGIQKEHLSNMLKSDVLDDGKVIDSLVNKTREISPSVVPYLLHYRDADEFKSNKFGQDISMPYRKTAYLFRTYRTERMGYNQLTAAAIRASKVISDTGRYFRLKCIYDSGVYYRIHEYEKENGNIKGDDYALLRVLLDMEYIDITQISRRRYLSIKFREYQEFKRFKYSD